MKYWDCLAEYDAESTSWSAPSGVGGSTTTGAYSPLTNGKLVGLRVIINRDAATSLTNHVQFKLSCPTFTPNSLIVGGQGSGLQTAPAFQSGRDSAIDYEIDEPCQTGSPIQIQARDVTADTPVTNSVLLYGCFSTG